MKQAEKGGFYHKAPPFALPKLASIGKQASTLCPRNKMVRFLATGETNLKPPPVPLQIVRFCSKTQSNPRLEAAKPSQNVKIMSRPKNGRFGFVAGGSERTDYRER